MERGSFEVSGKMPNKRETAPKLGDFNWRVFEPPLVVRLREMGKTDKDAAELLQTMEMQMESIAELAKEAQVEFRKTVDVSNEGGADPLQEEGIISSGEADLYKRQMYAQQSPLPRMIRWGLQNGIVTNEEASKLFEAYTPEV